MMDKSFNLIAYTHMHKKVKENHKQICGIPATGFVQIRALSHD